MCIFKGHQQLLLAFTQLYGSNLCNLFEYEHFNIPCNCRDQFLCIPQCRYVLLSCKYSNVLALFFKLTVLKNLSKVVSVVRSVWQFPPL